MAAVMAFMLGCEGKEAKTQSQVISENGEDTTPPLIINEDGFDMVFVQGGTFFMGCSDEERENCANCFEQRSVNVDDFFIGKTEVTQGLWVSVMDSNPSKFRGDERLPVEMVSWKDADGFIRKLNAKTGRKYRLPTGKEWTYAARGGNKSKGYTYSGGKDLGKVAWYEENSGGKTHPVGTKLPNELLIHDMTGNVWEWSYYNGGISNGSYVYGGGQKSVARHSCVSSYHFIYTFSRYEDTGFRLAMTSPFDTAFTDSRDGKVYKKVEIGKFRDIWMAENIDYGTDSSKCYGDNPSNCAKYGRLYNWADAMKVCPKGWHLSNDFEWKQLMAHVSGYYERTAVTKLKSPTGWNSDGGVPTGTDEYGFSALPGGYGTSGGKFFDAGNNGYWWTSMSTYAPSDSAWSWRTSKGYYRSDISDNTRLFSVRCVRDD